MKGDFIADELNKLISLKMPSTNEGNRLTPNCQYMCKDKIALMNDIPFP